MPLKRFAFVLGLLLLPFCITAVAQKAEAAFVAGGSFVSDSNFSFTISCTIPPCFTDSGTLQSGRHVFVEGNPAVQVIDAKGAKLHFEVPIVGIPSHSVQLSDFQFAVDHLSSVFVTPALRLKLLPGSAIAPFGSFGAGWAHYGVDNGSNNSFAVQFGGGVEFKSGIPHLGFRGEVRDFVTGAPNFGGGSFHLNTHGLRRHNILPGGGVVLKF